MRIGFDATILRGPITGIGYYTELLMATLPDTCPDLTVLGYDGFRMRPAAGRRPVVTSAGRSHGDIAALARKISWARKLYRTAKALNFRSEAGKVDLFHATNYLPPARIKSPWIPLVHDVSHIRHPDWHPAERVRWLESRHDEFLDAPVVNTVSQFSADEIQATLGIPASRIRITYPGVNPIFFQSGVDRSAVLARYQVLEGRYFLCVGALEPRKNLKTAVKAYAGLPEDIQESHPLLVVGPAGWGQLDMPPETLELERRGRLRFCGYVCELDMHALYQHASAFLFPSFYEGFGMPVAEAMATGTRPVIAPLGAPAEVAGKLGYTAPAAEPEAWRDAMVMAIDEDWHGDKSLRGQLKKQAARFTWAENARQTCAMYKDILSQSGVSA